MIDDEGNIVVEPWALQKAKLIDGLCQRYSCLPSQLMKEDADLILPMIKILGYDKENPEQEKLRNDPMMTDLLNRSKSL